MTMTKKQRAESDRVQAHVTAAWRNLKERDRGTKKMYAVCGVAAEAMQRRKNRKRNQATHRHAAR